MRDISAKVKELKGHNILSVERFRDSTKWMIEFSVKVAGTYGNQGDEVRLFLDDVGYQRMLDSQSHNEIKITKYAHIIEGHILESKPKKHRRK